MPTAQEGLASVDLGSTKQVGLRLVAEGRFNDLSEACRAGLRRLDEDGRALDQLVALGEQGMASGVADGFDVNEFIEEAQTTT